MPQPAPQPTSGIPPWLAIAGSVAIAGHLLALFALALAAPNGPWPTADGSSMGTPPQFAQLVNSITAPNYLRPLRLTHNYHFPSDWPEAPGVYFEVHLKDEAGQVVETLQFPDPQANRSVRQRQALLARGLIPDVPVPPSQQEMIAAPGRAVPSVDVWERDGKELKLHRVALHLLPRDQPVFRPNDWALLLAHSYARYLCRTHNAASVELVRHTREPYPPALMFMTEAPAGAFDEITANFGELSR